MFARAPRGGQGVVQGDFAVTDSAKAGKAHRPDGVGLGFACGVVQSGQLFGRRA